MRLFAIVDGNVDRYERAALLTVPFDMALTGGVVRDPTRLRRWRQADGAAIRRAPGSEDKYLRRP